MSNVNYSNFSSNVEELRKKLKATQDEKEAKAANKTNTTFVDNKFHPEIVGPKATYVLRILPNMLRDEGLSEPWVKTFVHIFPNPQGVKKFALCPKTLDDKAPCPMCEKAKALFVKVNDKTASRVEEDTARRFYKKPRYFVNVEVLEDPRKGEKNQTGQVLAWEIGPQIFDRFNESLVDRKMDFYHPTKGNNFSLVIKQKGEHPNYESSFFDTTVTPINADESKIEAVLKKCHNLEKIALGRGARPYEELQLLMEGKDIPKQERTWDSQSGVTESRPMNRPQLNENIDIDDKPVNDKNIVKSTSSAHAAPAVAESDADILAQLDELGSELK